MPSVRFQSYLPQETHSQLVQVARSLRIPAAEAVRRAVKQFVSKHEPTPVKNTKSPQTIEELLAILKKLPRKPGRFASPYDKDIYSNP